VELLRATTGSFDQHQQRRHRPEEHRQDVGPQQAINLQWSSILEENGLQPTHITRSVNLWSAMRSVNVENLKRTSSHLLYHQERTSSTAEVEHQCQYVEQGLQRKMIPHPHCSPQLR
jgi:hypothetical protein